MSQEIAPGVVEIHGNQYETVALRVRRFRQDCPGYAITTERSHEIESDRIVFKCIISDPHGYPVATGHAEETRTGGGVNSTDAMENCETSAVGRALAFFGYTGTRGIATEEDVRRAQAAQMEMLGSVADEIIEAMETDGLSELVADKLKSKGGTKPEDLSESQAQSLRCIAEIWSDLDRDQVETLWTAQSKGGPFTNKQRQVLKTEAFRKALNEVKK